MQPFVSHQGRAVLLERENVDTDQIIPKQFLKSIRRTGFGETLFADWRYLADGSDNPSFELNAPAARGATVLIVGNNFGCGSSREHAVWALAQYGFRVVIAPTKGSATGVIPGFAEIFHGNALKNGLLAIELDPVGVDALKHAVKAYPGDAVTIDLPAQEIRLGDFRVSFAIDPGIKDKLVRGLDDIAMTLAHESDIAAFERARRDFAS